MRKEQLITEIMESVQSNLGKDYHVTLQETLKNNDLSLTGIVIHKKGINVAPVIYIDQFITPYDAEPSVNAVAQKVLYLYRQHSIADRLDLSVLTDFQSCKDKIVFQLVNTGQNRSLLKAAPSIQFLDLSIIFKIMVGQDAGEILTITITNKIMDTWKVRTGAVCEAAFKNTPVLCKAVIRGMNDVLSDFTDDCLPLSGADFMYVLTNRQLSCGCGCMIYPHVLENFAQKLGEDLIILPSSVNEVLLVPDLKGHGNFQFFSETVREVNRTVLSHEEFLSDNVYHFSRKDKKITIMK